MLQMWRTELSYCDACENCGKKFETRHYNWMVCIECHKEGLDDENSPCLADRIANKEELN